MTTDKSGELRHCCGQPPRLLSDSNFGHAFICTECGNGVQGCFHGNTREAAETFWNSAASRFRKPDGFMVPLFLLKELNDAHDVLRNLAYTLGVGGYNASQVDAEVFSKKIHEGLDMLVRPLTDRIHELERKLKKATK